MSLHAKVLRAKEAYEGVILAKPNVVGVGVAYRTVGKRITDELCVVALVHRKVPKAGLSPDALVPRAVAGVPTDVVQVGELRAFEGRITRWRPAPGGVSVGHYKVTAGTLGAQVRDRSTGRPLLLSNNHVLANSNDARPGDPIVQPGAADGGRVERDTLARLERFEPIRFTREPPTCDLAIGYARVGNWLAGVVGSRHRLEVFQVDPLAVNRVDAAVARPLQEEDLVPEILDIGVVGGVTAADLGMAVRKSGRTTGFSTGQVTVLEATLTVGYGAGKSARFAGQIVTTPMSKPGDSGSLLVAGDSPLAVGLLFAGSEEATVHNPIQDVLEALDVVL